MVRLVVKVTRFWFVNGPSRHHRALKGEYVQRVLQIDLWSRAPGTTDLVV